LTAACYGTIDPVDMMAACVVGRSTVTNSGELSFGSLIGARYHDPVERHFKSLTWDGDGAPAMPSNRATLMISINDVSRLLDIAAWCARIATAFD
jgi:hypothetical protein